MKIDITGVKKTYGNRTVLEIGALHIPSGKITAVVGPNGAGKTTLLNLVAGLVESDCGQILYNGEKSIPFQRMTMVFQKPCMISSTVRKNIVWPLKIRGVGREEAAAEVERLAEKLGLTSFLDRRADRLSAGEMEKTALARALSFDPDLLLLDEPGANMDPHALIEMEAMLRRLPAERQKTVLLVTHNLAQAARLADDVLFLNEGRAAEHCGVKEFFECPVQEETKRFLEIDWR